MGAEPSGRTLNASFPQKRGAMHRPIDRIALQRIGTSSAVAKETGMSPKNILDEVLSSRFLATDRDVVATRRALLLASPIAGLLLAAAGTAAQASSLDPAETAITLPTRLGLP
jgi:hypothetical protein